MIETARLRIERFAKSPTVLDLVRVAAVYLAYLPIEFLVMRGYSMPARSYEQRFIVVELARHLWPFPVQSASDVVTALGWIVALGLAYFGRRTLFGPWSRLDDLQIPRRAGAAFAGTRGRGRCSSRRAPPGLRRTTAANCSMTSTAGGAADDALLRSRSNLPLSDVDSNGTSPTCA